MQSSIPADFSNFELEITDRCNLQCPRCSRTEFLEKFPHAKLNHDLSLEDFKKFIAPVLDQVKIFEFKGTMGDPIFHPQFLDWIRWAKAEGKQVNIHTNGQRGGEMWHTLSTIVDKDDYVYLGIDGAPSNFHLYRVGAKWTNLDLAMTGLGKSCHVVWQFILFNYNVASLEVAQRVAEYKEVEFKIVYSSKWKDSNDPLRPNQNVLALPRGDMETSEIEPDCHKRPMHIVTADGYYMPCCYLIDPRWRYKTPFAKQFPVNANTINDVMKSNVTEEFFAKLTNDTAPAYCRFQCGKCFNGK